MHDFPTAYFVRNPFRIEDLKKPHPIESEKPYVIEKTIVLSAIDYQNFITDLCVDRWFIEANTHLTKVDKNGIWHCIFVKKIKRKDGILVMSEGKVYPNWAAYVS